MPFGRGSAMICTVLVMFAYPLNFNQIRYTCRLSGGEWGGAATITRVISFTELQSVRCIVTILIMLSISGVKRNFLYASKMLILQCLWQILKWDECSMNM